MFQKKVNAYPAKGVPGQVAGFSLAELKPVPMAGENGVQAGCAVWASNTPNTVQNSGTGTPLGMVRRVMTSTIAADQAATMHVQAGASVAVVVRGDMLVASAEAVSAGQTVFASLTTGELKGGAAGSTVSGFVETDWTVRESAAAGTVFLISNW